MPIRTIRNIATFILTIGFCMDMGLLVSARAEGGTAVPAEQSSAAVTPEQAQQNPAGKFVQDMGNQAIKVIADKSLTKEQHASKYHDILQKAFDIPTIGHFVLGRAWNTATPEQQQEYLKLFEAIVIKIYGDRLDFYSGEHFVVNGVRNENDKDVVVNSEVQHPGSAHPTSVYWRVRQTDGKFAVVDVSVEGVSQSVTQRQEYTSILQRNGGNIDALLSMMRQQVNGKATAQSL